MLLNSGEGSLPFISNMSQTKADTVVKYKITCLDIMATPNCCKEFETFAEHILLWTDTTTGDEYRKQRWGQRIANLCIVFIACQALP